MAKKEKITYIDDGRTIADMSSVPGGFKPAEPKGYPTASMKEKLSTFFGAMRMMLLPTLAVSLGLALIFGIAYLLFSAM